MERGESPEALRISGDDYSSSPSSSSSSSAESSFRELDDVFLQTQTRIWLGEVLQIRLDERMAVSDLLADGELLFEVSKVVWKMLLTQHMEPRHLKSYRNEPFASRKTSGRYMPYSNVDSFLKICKILGLAGIDLFSPSDVVEKRDTRKVCICIRSFSRKARSKHLRVPDFDIVTYTVAMSTDMVGCIRRSWEPRQCSLLNSASYNLHKDSSEKFRQENPIVNLAINYDMHSEEFDGTESNQTVTKSDCLLTKLCYDTTSKVNSDSERCREVFTVVKHDTLAEHILQLNIQNQEKSDCSHCQFESDCTTESVGSLSTQNGEHSHQLNSLLSPFSIDSQIQFSGRASHVRSLVKESNEIDGRGLIYSTYHLGYDASIIEDSINGYTPPGSSFSNSLEISGLLCHTTDSSDTVVYNGEHGFLDASSSIGSHCSNSTPGIFENGSRRRLVDIFDAEVSSDASTSSVRGAVLNLDLDDRLYKEDNPKTFQFPELQDEEAGFLTKKTTKGYTSQDIVKYETKVHRSTDSENVCFCTELEDNSSSTKLFLPYPDQLNVTGHPDHVFAHDNGTCMSLVNSDVVSKEDLLPQIESDALKNVNCTLSCQSHPAFDFHNWDIKGKFASAMVLNEYAGHGASPESVSLEKTISRTPTEASLDAFCLKDMKSVVDDNDKEICSSIMVNLDSNVKKHQNKFSQGVCLANILDRAHDNLNTSPNIVAVDLSKSSSMGDGSCFQNQEITIGDIEAQVKCTPAIVTVNNPSAHYNSVIPANPREPTLDNNSFLTVECPENVVKKGHQACTYLNDCLHCTEHIDKVHSQDAIIDGKVDTSAVEDLDRMKHASVGTPESKPHKRLLLKSVLGGTAAFGLLFLLFHLRVHRDKGGESSGDTCQIWKANVREFSSRKGHKGSKANGIYPAEKLKFGD
ncbi:uncharacterized protein LOC109007107 isoform X2 [Juglans regia]|uniref:Uncharacterized protein LOC109007107 isoform X2 n=2 Tax=Juglans regia TaxID=51240 RepID=A0A6P9EGI2_JUGRE|nr:uncharacterized protein LOC109007107 isoform X2 [Juglans regia]